jgi:hypothetical protein
MASHRRWISFNDVNEHPEDDILLAYLRGQQLEAHSSIIQHIEQENCSVCLQKLNELKQVCTTLDVLGDMRSYQYYPELSVADTYARMQSRQTSTKTTMVGEYYQPRPRKSAVRLISVPVALGLAVLFTVAMIVFANLSGRSFNSFLSTGSTSPDQQTLTMVVQPHSTSTPDVNLIATAIAKPDRSSESKEPYIKVCSTQANIAQLRLLICGFHFDSAHKATLIVSVPGKKLIWLRNIPVDKHGKLQVGWFISDCSYMPTIIYGYEVTSSKPIYVKLQITSFDSCLAPTTTPVGRPSGFPQHLGR